MHFLYIALLVVYINAVYVHNIEDDKEVFEIMIIFGVIYPAVYDMVQMYKTGIQKYFTQLSNYGDMIYVWGSVLNVIL